MQRAALFGLVATVALANQVPLSAASHPWHQQDVHQVGAVLSHEDLAGWNLDKLSNPTDTDHLVFETVHSLLQHWPNTRFRNGHNIVPAVIPKGTVLYHATNVNKLPLSPEWLATDPEHAYIFCVDPSAQAPQPACWFFTLVATRPLKVVYFDGTSAANIPTGTMDTQELIAWGEIHSGNMKEEVVMVQNLCRWGEKLGVDGFVRMEMDFEVILCDFTAGLSVLSSVNLPDRKGIRHMGPGFINFEVIDAGSWHNRFPGETRIQPDLAGLVSFYDTQLVPSLVAIRVGQERWDHRVQNTSSEDLLAVKSRLEAALIRPSGLSSGIDWKTLVHVIVDRFAGRLELTRHLLNSSTEPSKVLDFAKKTQSQFRIMLTPYILFSAMPIDSSNKADLDWTKPIYKLCATTHTYPMESELDSMTDSERSILRAIRGTSREVCRVVTKMWAAGVYAGVDQSLNTKESPDIAEVTQVWSEWAEDLDQLMTWLDWDVWVKCNPGCGPEEMCYLPTWPIGFYSRRRRPSRRPSPSLSNSERPYPERLAYFNSRTKAAENVGKNVGTTVEREPLPDGLRRPQPKCIRRVAPQGF